MEPIPSAWLLLSMPLLAVLVGLIIVGTKKWHEEGLLIWLYVYRYRVGYWVLVGFSLWFDFLMEDFRDTAGLLFLGFLWWLYKLFQRPTGTMLGRR